MSFDYAGMAALATNLIRQFGFPADISRPGPMTGPEHRRAPGLPALIPCVMVWDDYRKSEVDGSLVQRQDRKALVAATGVEPTTEDRLLSGGVEFAIVTVSPIAPGNVPVAWVLQVRR